jgi:hypothetical protein
MSTLRSKPKPVECQSQSSRRPNCALPSLGNMSYCSEYLNPVCANRGAPLRERLAHGWSLSDGPRFQFGGILDDHWREGSSGSDE